MVLWEKKNHAFIPTLTLFSSFQSTIATWKGEVFLVRECKTNMHIATSMWSNSQYWNLDSMKAGVENVLSSFTPPMTWTMVTWTSFINLKWWTTNRLFVTSWCHNLMVGFSWSTWKGVYADQKYLLKVVQEPMSQMFQVSWVYNNDVLASSLIDSNVNLKWKQWKSKELGPRSLTCNTLGVEGCAGALGWD